MTTVEIVVEEKDWKQEKNKIPYNKIVRIRVMYDEYEVISLVKHAGGKWNRSEKVWEISYREVISLGLEERMVPGSD